MLLQGVIAHLCSVALAFGITIRPQQWTQKGARMDLTLQSDLKCFCNNKHIGTQMLYCHLFFEGERCLIAMFITTAILDWCLFLHHFVLTTVHVKICISFSHCLCVGECACTNRVNELDLSDNVVGQCLLCHCHWLLFGIPCVSHLKGVTFSRAKFLV